MDTTSWFFTCSCVNFTKIGFVIFLLGALQENSITTKKPQRRGETDFTILTMFLFWLFY